MGIKTAQISGLSDLATWLNENCAGLFGSVEYSSSTLTATDKDDNKILEIVGNACRAYRSESSYISSDLGTASFGSIDVISCDNGVILKSSYTYNISRSFGILISKTNNGNRLAVIYSAGGTTSTDENYAYTALKHVAYGDDATQATTTTFTPEDAQQTVLCPFATNAAIGSTSYTPMAFYMPMCQNYDSGINKFITSGKQYITNGYWAIDASEG